MLFSKHRFGVASAGAAQNEAQNERALEEVDKVAEWGWDYECTVGSQPRNWHQMWVWGPQAALGAI